MNDEIRAQVQARLDQKHMTRADLARTVGRTPQEISRALNGSAKGAGSVPPLWASILEALDLDLTVSPKKASGEGEKGQP